MFWTKNVSTWGRRLVIPAAASMGLISCADPVLDVKVNIVKQFCGGPDPMLNVAQFKVTVYGQNVDSDAVQTRFEVADGKGDLPKIPVGTGRNIVIEALDASDKVISRGETGPLDLAKSDAKETVNATVFLRAVDSFTPSNIASDPGSCSKLIQARAGHTATKLTDGRVLIAGGYRIDGATKTYNKSTEIYDPKTGITSPGPEILPRTFHTATQIPGTKLTLIAGGETDGAAVGAAQIYDEETNSIVANIPMKAKRTRHVAILGNPVEGGQQPPIVLLGGFTNSDANVGAPTLKSAEALDMTTSPPQFRDVTATLNLQKGLAEATAVPLIDGTGRVVVLGGWDGQNAVKNVLFLQYSASQSGYVQVASTTTLLDAHLWPVASTSANGLLMLTGGFQSHDPSTGELKNPTTSTEYLNVKVGGPLTKAQLAALPEAVGFISGTPLLNGKLLLVGGQASTGSSDTGSMIELAETNLKRRPTSNNATQKRHLHATTLLDDGTVLVTGGLQAAGSSTSALDQIDIFQPAYAALGSDPHN